METKKKGSEGLPGSVVFRFRHVKILRVHRSLVHSLEYFQSRRKVDYFLGAQGLPFASAF